MEDVLLIIFLQKNAYLQFPWSEKQKINTDPLEYRIYEFSAFVQIETTGLNASQNTIFQIHDFRNKGAPPSYLQVYRGEFEFKVIFEYLSNAIKTNYYITKIDYEWW